MDFLEGLKLLSVLAAAITIAEKTAHYGARLLKKMSSTINLRRLQNKSIPTTTSRLPITLAMSDNLFLHFPHHGSQALLKKI